MEVDMKLSNARLESGESRSNADIPQLPTEEMRQELLAKSKVNPKLTDQLYEQAEECAVSSPWEAYDHISKHLVLEPDSEYGLRLRARLAGNLGFHSQARIDLMALVDQGCCQPSLLLELGEASIACGQYLHATEVLEHACRVARQWVQPWLLRARAWRHLGHCERAMADLERALFVDPDSLAAILEQGHVWLLAGNLGNAIACATLCINESYERWEAFVLLGEALLEAEAWQEADDCISQALDEDTSDWAVWNLSGRAKLALGDLEGALEAFDHALTLDRSQPEPHAYWAVLCASLGLVPEADSSLQEACSLDLSSTEPLRLAAQGALGCHRHEEAREWLGKMLLADSNNAWALARLGWLAMDEDDLCEAIPLLEQSVEIDPSIALHGAWLATARNLNGDLEGSHDTLEAALLLHPESAPLRLMMAALLVELERSEEALEILDILAKEDLPSAEWFQTRAVALVELDRLPEALTMATTLISLEDPAYNGYELRALIFTELGMEDIARSDRAHARRLAE